MHQRILTKTEIQRIEQYLQDTESTHAIRVLRYRAKKFLPVIEKEVNLLKRLLKDSPKR